MATRPSFRERLGDVIFETDTPPARLFDVLLLAAIVASVLLVMLESVDPIQARHGPLLRTLEWAFTLLFTAEYAARIYTARDRRRYATSFYGVVDLLAILPSYLGLLLPGAQTFVVIRSLRLLRVFRVLKLVQFLGEASTLAQALRASRHKIIVFVVSVLAITVIIGSAMHLVEGQASGFDNIPLGVYWAIVTLTTVGYGDIAPITPVGRFLAGMVMILGYGIIAVPTGIVTSELSRADRERRGRQELEPERPCARCGLEHHQADARYCRRCGEALPG